MAEKKVTDNKKTTTNKVVKEKTTKKDGNSKIINKVESLTLKQIFNYSLVPFIGIALYFYFDKNKEKKEKSIKGFFFGMLIIFVIGVITGGILWLMK